MKCPCCESEMQEGVLQSLNYIVWLEKPVAMKKPHRASGAKPLPLQYHGALNMGIPYVNALRCPKCECVVVKQDK